MSTDNEVKIEYAVCIKDLNAAVDLLDSYAKLFLDCESYEDAAKVLQVIKNLSCNSRALKE